jgi:membrane associated rhomboid family serine protease
MLILPIRTESAVRRRPLVNHALIVANLFIFLFFYTLASNPRVQALQTEVLAFHADRPQLHQFLSYQFLHADPGHLLANMLFLWVFGNSVNSKMRDLPYLLFYLAGGIFAAWGHAMATPGPSRLIGASGAIAAVTTAYLALFPRSHVTVLVWFVIFIQFFEVPAMIVIGLKIIVWDNIVAPTIGQQGSVAHSAHLAGYLFGFLGALGMLFLRAIPRDQFDMLALWRRWQRRRELAVAFQRPDAMPSESIGPTFAGANASASQPDRPEPDRAGDLRGQIADALRKRSRDEAARLYEQLVALDPQSCLPERDQLEIGREFYNSSRFPLAAAAFERFVERYGQSAEVPDVLMLLGIIYARDLRRYDLADRYLAQSLGALRDESRRTQCRQWLDRVRTGSGNPAPQT